MKGTEHTILEFNFDPLRIDNSVEMWLDQVLGLNLLRIHWYLSNWLTKILLKMFLYLTRQSSLVFHGLTNQKIWWHVPSLNN